jgi:tetratricopeptide (TPR) repeat protein
MLRCWLLTTTAAAALAPPDRRTVMNQVAAAASTLFVPRARAAPPPTLQGAYAAFNAGKYDDALAAFTTLTTTDAADATAWEGKGTVELILGSQKATLGRAPEGPAKELCESAVASLQKAATLSDDTLTLNNLGNAQAVLLRWSDAADSYQRSLDAALASKRDRGLASIPASNRAQVAVELGDLKDAARRTENLLRRDPNFVDGRALLAAVRYKLGDANDAEAAYAQLCVPGVKSQSGVILTDGIGGSDYCELYATSDVVKGRWTPTTIEAYEAFLKSRDPRARVAANTRDL